MQPQISHATHDPVNATLAHALHAVRKTLADAGYKIDKTVTGKHDLALTEAIFHYCERCDLED